MLDSVNTVSSGASCSESPASSAIGQLGMSINALQDRFEELAARISPVLTPPIPVNTSKSDSPSSPIPLVDQILQQTIRVRSLADGCSSLIERVGV